MTRLIRNMKYDWCDAENEKLTRLHKLIFLSISIIARSAEWISKVFDRIDLKVSNFSTRYLYNHSRKNDNVPDYRDYDY